MTCEALTSLAIAAGIAAAPVMTLYELNDEAELPYYAVGSGSQRGTAIRAASLPQGTALIPCLVWQHACLL
jgi:hypothetical protein